MEKVVISIGGSILASPKPNLSYIKDFAKMVKGLKDDGVLPLVVVGGGQVARDYQVIARDFGADPDFLDRVGILATRLNAMLLIAALGEDVQENVPEEPVKHSGDKILVMGGVKPGQTTDAVSAQLAVVNGAKLLINATNVDGVYDSDPRKNPDAKLFDNLSFDDLIGIVGTSHRPGVNAVLDPVAAGIIRESKIKTLIVNGTDVANIREAITDDSFKGTTVE